MEYQTLTESMVLAATNCQSAYSISTIRRETAIVKIEPFQMAVNSIKNELFKYVKFYIAHFP